MGTHASVSNTATKQPLFVPTMTRSFSAFHRKACAATQKINKIASFELILAAVSVILVYRRMRSKDGRKA
jgi:hypothetical protein